MKASVLLRVYPAAWRRRYGEELEDLLGKRQLTPSLALDLARGALHAHLHPELLQPVLHPAGGSHLDFSTLKRPSALIPLAMSLAALSLVLGHVAMFGPAREADEGTAAHLWQLLMAGQLPVIAFFAIRWLPRTPRQALLILALQAVAGLAAAAPVFILQL
jgi:hypothetical protein